MAKSGRIGNDAVHAKTGRPWTEWFNILDQYGAAKRGHKATAQFLFDRHRVTGWWAQTITVEYERMRGLRKLGQKETGWEVSVQRTIQATKMDAWSALVDDDAALAWLRKGPAPRKRNMPWTPSSTDRIKGTFRAAWDEGTGRPATRIDITITPTGTTKVAVRVQHTKLPSATARKQRQAQWGRALDALKTSLES
jgi:hypothetical protein